MTISGSGDADSATGGDAAAERLLARAEANLVAARRTGRERLALAAD